MFGSVWMDVLILTPLLTLWWAWRNHNQATRRFLRDRGLPVMVYEEAAEDDLAALAEPAGLGALQADVEVAALRARPDPEGGVRLEADVIVRDNPGVSVQVKLGLFQKDGAPFQARNPDALCRFEDGAESLGRTAKTPPAARSFAYWHGVWALVPRVRIPLQDGPYSFQVRCEVWLNGRREASSREAIRVEVGRAGEGPGSGPECASCQDRGATMTCPRCREPHHEICFDRNKGCTRLACAHQVQAGEDVYSRPHRPADAGDDAADAGEVVEELE